MGLAALLSGYSIVLALARLLSNPIPPPLSKQGAVELRTASYLQQLCDARDRTVPIHRKNSRLALPFSMPS
jgi:hypothetical protein